ncbi:MAG TPA: ubiquinol-cytochrome C chaperone family protein [Geminicoccaceae bacterium]|nr:ubiquinol-cytochrome C chaperone family protein [Geminicoccaceae bacterium]
MNKTPVADASVTRHGWRRLWRRLRQAERAHDGRRQVAEQLYRAVVNQARSQVWYRELGVPDTPEGRFEMVALHAALLLRRLQREGVAGQALGQQLFDTMFVDLDGSLRELGVSDLSLGRYVKRLAGNFYARLAALDAGLGDAVSRPAVAGDGVAAGARKLHRMLRSNVYHDGTPSDRQLAFLARCLVEQDRALAAQDGAAVCGGTIVWVEPQFPPGT